MSSENHWHCEKCGAAIYRIPHSTGLCDWCMAAGVELNKAPPENHQHCKRCHKAVDYVTGLGCTGLCLECWKAAHMEGKKASGACCCKECGKGIEDVPDHIGLTIGLCITCWNAAVERKKASREWHGERCEKCGMAIYDRGWGGFCQDCYTAGQVWVNDAFTQKMAKRSIPWLLARIKELEGERDAANVKRKELQCACHEWDSIRALLRDFHASVASNGEIADYDALLVQALRERAAYKRVVDVVRGLGASGWSQQNLTAALDALAGEEAE